LATYVGNVDGTGQFSTQQRVAHCYAHIYGDIALRFHSRRTNVWSKHNVCALPERMVCR
jgi:hypothetical protein